MAETMAILSENVTDFLGRLALHFFLFDKTDFGFESILRKSDSDLLLCLLSKLEFIGGSDFVFALLVPDLSNLEANALTLGRTSS
jgi:hypothetical protein